MIAHTLRGEGFDASEDGTGRGTPLYYSHDYNQDRIYGTDGPAPAPGVDLWNSRLTGEVAATIGCSTGTKTGYATGPQVLVPATVAIRGRDGGGTAEMGGDVATALRASTGGGDKAHVMVPIGFNPTSVHHDGVQHGISQTLKVGSGGLSGAAPGVSVAGAVRRLTPRECERLQGFPDDHTLVPYRNKPACDGPRYKAIGNSMAVPVLAWIGDRIARYETTD